MAFIAAADPASKVSQTFPDPWELARAVMEQGWIAIRPDGTAYTAQIFEGGLLLDGAPLNVYYRDAWYPEQRELLTPHWGKDIPVPNAALLALPVVNDELAQAALAEYHAWKSAQGGGGFSPWLWLAIAGFGAYWLFAGQSTMHESD